MDCTVQGTRHRYTTTMIGLFDSKTIRSQMKTTRKLVMSEDVGYRQKH